MPALPPVEPLRPCVEALLAAPLRQDGPARQVLFHRFIVSGHRTWSSSDLLALAEAYRCYGAVYEPLAKCVQALARARWKETRQSAAQATQPIATCNPATEQVKRERASMLRVAHFQLFEFGKVNPPKCFEDVDWGG